MYGTMATDVFYEQYPYTDYVIYNTPISFAWCDPQASLDERKNRKSQAKWFRELIDWIVGPAREMKIIAARGYRSITECARASPIAREWKMKSWKQMILGAAH